MNEKSRLAAAEAFDLGARSAPLLAIAVASFLVALNANFLILRRAAAPPDDNHADGHERFEGLAALGQGIFLGAAIIFLVSESVKRLASGVAPARSRARAAALESLRARRAPDPI